MAAGAGGLLTTELVLDRKLTDVVMRDHAGRSRHGHEGASELDRWSVRAKY
jgi:hypothetical protein